MFYRDLQSGIITCFGLPISVSIAYFDQIGGTNKTALNSMMPYISQNPVPITCEPLLFFYLLWHLGQDLTSKQRENNLVSGNLRGENIWKFID
jgi:hypothetical protein